MVVAAWMLWPKRIIFELPGIICSTCFLLCGKFRVSLPLVSRPQDISISVLLLLQELTDSDVLSEREEASVIVDAIVDKQVLLSFLPFAFNPRVDCIGDTAAA